MIAATSRIPEAPSAEMGTMADPRIEALSVSRVVWYPGDTIRPNEKQFNPEWKGFGGVFLPHFKTTQHDGNKGMIYRCKFTLMQVHMRHENAKMIHPSEAKYWQSSYVLKNGRYDEATGTWHDQIVSMPGIIYKPDIYPGHEILEIVQRTPGNDVGGRVEITSFAGATQADLYELQRFFFPNWDEILAGRAFLPETLRELEEHIKERIQAIPSVAPARQAKYQKTANEMLAGCANYRTGGLAYLKTLEDDANFAKANGAPYTYPDLGLMLLEQLEQKRKDDLVSGESSAVDRLARTMEKRENADQELRRKELELKERELALRERELGIIVVPPRKPAAEAPVAESAVVEAPAEEPVEKPKTSQNTYDEPNFAAEAVDATAYKIGDEIETAQGMATVIAKPFGNLKVRLADGREEMLNKL